MHESDFRRSIANKLSVPSANHVLTTFPETVYFLPEKKTKYLGAVVREELLNGDPKKGFHFAGLNDLKPVLLVMGGSGGSEKINTVVRETINDLLPHFQVMRICGDGEVHETVQAGG